MKIVDIFERLTIFRIPKEQNLFYKGVSPICTKWSYVGGTKVVPKFAEKQIFDIDITTYLVDG